MADTIAITSPTVVVNGRAVEIIPNSGSYTEGKGEQTMTTVSLGGGSVKNIYSDNVENKKSMVKFSVKPTNEMISLVRGWKVNQNNNAISIFSGDFRRTFTRMALISNYEVNLSADGVIDLEWEGDPAV